MKPFTIRDMVAGTTIKTTCRNLSGQTPDSISSALFSGSETLVNSVAAVSSGDGRYYAFHNLPSSNQWYVNRWEFASGGRTFGDFQYLRAIVPRVE